MRKSEGQKARRDKLQKIGELALRAFFNSFPSRRRRNFKNPTFEVILASGKEMASLKKNKDKKVDVLAFRESENFPLPPYRVARFDSKMAPLSFFPPEADPPWAEKIKNNLGEIYLNWDLKPRDFERLAFLFLHGLCHLLGFSHEKERDMIEMEKIEKKIWRQICFWA